ncbi:hypothetical protein ECL_A258 (plasmid) [Enterobacter cloacae subsp. cloacae ATCC 13047]|uniref:Uncharacterized protein n=1 Tax=Enterobacter cloacae subsp. cloacae (strain ATCC 13047 / DSM 30054 / NBRC 13535 / NCTC 10005 / WDCM 00083 / NCDC 279-56) TaxID=716541 RepID=A0A0H3CUP7_ENTCC|nr:hypothetical protein ECL_A258 [Enterobacter cloacae subsp. cloacae ATCC 13047]OOC77717.1 hypothetical protein BWP06_26035 [Enterobacter cloacae]UWX37989.1 hypothetical protein KK477_p0675 [Klebsiella pneumoniae]
MSWLENREFWLNPGSEKVIEQENEISDLKDRSNVKSLTLYYKTKC